MVVLNHLVVKFLALIIDLLRCCLEVSLGGIELAVEVPIVHLDGGLLGSIHTSDKETQGLGRSTHRHVGDVIAVIGFKSSFLAVI